MNALEEDGCAYDVMSYGRPAVGFFSPANWNAVLDALPLYRTCHLTDPSCPTRPAHAMTPTARCRLSLSGLGVLLTTLAVCVPPRAGANNIAQLTPGNVEFQAPGLPAPDRLLALGVTEGGLVVLC